MDLPAPVPNRRDRSGIRAEKQALHQVTKPCSTTGPPETTVWEVGDRALIPASEWPDETSAEHQGQGWEVEIEDVTTLKRRPTRVLVSFVHARDSKGKQFERQLLKGSVLLPLPESEEDYAEESSGDTKDRPEIEERLGQDTPGVTNPDTDDSHLEVHADPIEPLKKEIEEVIRRSQRDRNPINRFDPIPVRSGIKTQSKKHGKDRVREENVAAVFDAWAPFDLRHQTDAGLLKEAKSQAPLSLSDVKALTRELEQGTNRQIKADKIDACQRKLETPSSTVADYGDWVDALKKGGHDDLRLWSPKRRRRGAGLGGPHGCEPPPIYSARSLPKTRKERSRLPSGAPALEREGQLGTTEKWPPPSSISPRTTFLEQVCEEAKLMSTVEFYEETRRKKRGNIDKNQTMNSNQTYEGPKGSRRLLHLNNK